MGKLSQKTFDELGISKTALQLAAQAWAQEETINAVVDVALGVGVARVIDPLLDHLELAWGLIANAGQGDWNKESEEWTKAANRWRNEWHNILDAKLLKKERNKKHAKNITNK